MGSRIMHAIIGHKIAERLAIKDKASFMFGSVAADAVFSVDEKNASHFFIGDSQDFSRRVDYDHFFHKYMAQNNHDYLLGYYTHLVADDIWLKGFYQSWLKNRMEADENLHKLYHRDFHLLNGKLLDYYSCSNEINTAYTQTSSLIDLDEVSAQQVKEFVPYVLGDVEYSEEALTEPLQVFTLEQIIGYVETSIKIGIHKLKKIQTPLVF